MRRDGITFNLICANANVDNESREGFNLTIPRFRKRLTCIGVGGRSGSGGKVKWHGWITHPGGSLSMVSLQILGEFQ